MADKQDDVDALLASLSEPASPEAKKLPAPAHEELVTYGERSQSFKIDPRDASISGTDKLRKDSKTLEVNPEDFTDHLSLREESRRKKLLFGLLGVMAFLLLLGFIGYNLVQSNTAQVLYKVPTDSTEEQRFLNLFPDAPAADTTKTITTVAFDNGLSIPDGYTLTFAGMDFSSLDYKASAAADFGPAAVAKVDGEWNGTTVYLFKDMAHSKAFSNAWNGEPVQVEGSPAAAVMLMELSSGVHAVLAIVNPDSTGFMVVLPQNLNYESALNLKNFVRIEKSVVNGNPTDTTSVTAANFLRFCSPRTNQQWTSPSYTDFGIDSKLRIDSVEVPFSDETKKTFQEADVLRLWGIKDENGNNLLYVQSNTSIFPLDAPTAEYRGEADRLKGEEAESYVAKIAATKEYDRLEECMAILAPSQKG